MMASWQRASIFRAFWFDISRNALSVENQVVDYLTPLSR